MNLDRLYVVSYDIPDDRRRTKVANLLKSYGERVQFSVFECWLDSAEIARLHDELAKRADLTEDSVRIYKSTSDIRILGVGTVTKNPEAWVA